MAVATGMNAIFLDGLYKIGNIGPGHLHVAAYHIKGNFEHPDCIYISFNTQTLNSGHPAIIVMNTTFDPI
jgi:hypothetical protein